MYNTKEGKSCVIYIRVSSERQVKGYSLDGQKHYLAECAERRVISIETVILAHRQRMQSAPAMASGVLTTSRECLAIRFIQGAWHGANDAQRKFPAKIMSIGL